MATEVEAAGTHDAEASPIPGYPFLRTNRFLASFSTTDMDAAAYRAWVERLRTLALESVRVEVGNLAPIARERLDERSIRAMQRPTIDAVTYCADVLSDDLLNSLEARRDLRDMMQAPDHYDDLKRAVGLYPITALPVALGYDSWRRSNLGTFGLEPQSLPTAGARIVYPPSDGSGALRADEVRAMLERSRDNPLGIPEPSDSDAGRLIAAFAPIWIVDTIGPDDRIGAISWDRDDTLAVAANQPVVYHKLTWTRFGGEILLQLNYLAWFPARTRQGAFDLLGGWLDGVIWRVTLGSDGRPLIYDSIHACGCYHLFFPVAPLIAKPGTSPHDIRERAEIPARAPELAHGDRIAVWLASVSHYIQAISMDIKTEPKIAEGHSYDMLPADQLRRLDRPNGGSRSMYGPDGIVDGTERRERFLLWPMGIANPGAMRQWGTHATAFVGRRHFDDPGLFDDAFQSQRGVVR